MDSVLLSRWSQSDAKSHDPSKSATATWAGNTSFAATFAVVHQVLATAIACLKVCFEFATVCEVFASIPCNWPTCLVDDVPQAGQASQDLTSSAKDHL